MRRSWPMLYNLPLTVRWSCRSKEGECWGSLSKCRHYSREDSRMYWTGANIVCCRATGVIISHSRLRLCSRYSGFVGDTGRQKVHSRTCAPFPLINSLLILE
jgi:hypothetical protein